MQPAICLGTAQFGLPYGITNAAGKVEASEVRALLEAAASTSLAFLDTAQAYGEAETVLGQTLPPNHDFKLINKLQPQSQSSFTAKDCIAWEKRFEDSLLRLRQPCIDALLLHSAMDLKKPGGEHLREWLISLRERKLVHRLGVSIYDSAELNGVPRELLDLVQLPLSLYDQRLLADGTIAQLRAQGCSVHARSLYLQGLLVSPLAIWPKWVKNSVCKHHAKLEKLAATRGHTLLECALSFARAQEHLEAVVIGICSREQLEELLRAWDTSSPWFGDEWNQWSLNEPEILDPRRWPQSAS